MRRSESSRTRSGRRRLAPVAVVLGLLCASGASALDVFSLWRQPRLEIDITDGAWVEYRTQKMEGGRRTDDQVRVQCVGDDGRNWTIEILPLRPTPDGLEPVPGEGWRFEISHDLESRDGDLVQHVSDVVHWQGGRANAVSEEQWREDPLITTSLKTGSPLGEVEEQDATTRVVSGRDLLCAQFTITAVDTGRVRLPRGELIQVSRDEVSVAVHDEVPFLGIAYAAQRVSTRSDFNSPGRRRPPPPSTRIEIMELTGFGRDAKAVLTPR